MVISAILWYSSALELGLGLGLLALELAVVLDSCEDPDANHNTDHGPEPGPVACTALLLTHHLPPKVSSTQDVFVQSLWANLSMIILITGYS